MFLTMTEIMLKMIAFGLECVVVLVLYFPTDTTGGNNAFNIFIGYLEVSDECIVVNLLSF